MHLRSLRADTQGQSVRPASQVCRCHAPGRGDRASRWAGCATRAGGGRIGRTERDMASVEKFEQHCWKDVVSAADMKLYAPHARETFVGPCAALLAVDLCNLVYRGGPASPCDLTDAHPGSHGHFAHAAIEPIRRLLVAARRARLPIFYSTQDERPNAYP